VLIHDDALKYAKQNFMLQQLLYFLCEETD